MAINGAEKSYPFMEFPLSMKRQGAFPMDVSSIYYSKEAAESYAKENPTAYVGQIIAVIEDGFASAYQIEDADGTLKPLGGSALEVATDEEVQAMLDEVFPKE